MSSSQQQRYPFVPESETEVYYPKSKRRVKLNSRWEIIEDTREKDEKGKRKEWMDGWLS